MTAIQTYIAVGILFYLYSLFLARAQPELTVDDGLSQLTGPQCLRMITFACTFLDFTSFGIGWYADDALLARYAFQAGTTFPIEFIPEPIIEATVMLSYANASGGRYNYYNYTLSANLTAFLPFQGQNITCGSATVRSNYFPINNLEGE